MPILLAIAGLLFGALLWWWRLRMMSDAAREAANEAGKIVQTVANAPRRIKFRFQSGKDGLALIDDPREAAAAMLVALAKADGREMLSDRQSVRFHADIERAFAFAKAERDDLLAQAEFIVRTAGDNALVFSKLSGLIVQSATLTAAEKSEFYEILVGLSECEGNPTRDQIVLLQIYQSKAGLLN